MSQQRTTPEEDEMMPSRLSLDMAHARQADLRCGHGVTGDAPGAPMVGARQWQRVRRLVMVSRHQLRLA
jgi:hypothetical protein